MTAIGALIGLSLSILLIIRKLSPTYSLIIGAIVGGLLGGLSLNETVTVMTEGVKEVTPAVLRILTAGVLSGILIQTGATTVISNAIINKMGEKRVFMALALATMLLCTVGVFIDVAVITVAPVALSIGKRLNSQRLGGHDAGAQAGEWRRADAHDDLLDIGRSQAGLLDRARDIDLQFLHMGARIGLHNGLAPHNADRRTE